jgi:hypothetical protein
LLAFLAGSHLLIYVLSLVSPAAGRADRAAIAALVCLAGLVVQTLGRMQRSSHRAVETAALFGALLAAGLATAYAVGDGAAGLLLMALFTFALAAAATPNLPLLLLAPWALASLLLWQADQITILFALQALLAVAVARPEACTTVQRGHEPAPRSLLATAPCTAPTAASGAGPGPLHCGSRA